MFFKRLIKYLFFCFIVKPYIYLVLGVNVSGAENLPKVDEGPSIIIANHNSHVDTLLLLSLFSATQLLKIHPVAAADYFFDTKWKSIFFRLFIGLIPIQRKIGRVTKEELFAEVNAALKAGETVIIYPEGTRGHDNTLQHFKSGVVYLAEMNPTVPIVPCYINGPDRILPKGSWVWVPFIADVYIAPAVHYKKVPARVLASELQDIVRQLKEEHRRKEEL